MRVPIVAAILALAASVYARPAPAAEALLNQPLIGGTPMRCYDYRGVLVRTLKTTQLGDVGRASIIGRMPIISLDTDRMAMLPEKLQVFFFMHECAHHVLGHIIRPTLQSERDADCWSANYGRWMQLFSREDVVGFGPFLAKSAGSRFGHLAGPERQAYILNCYDTPATEPVAALSLPLAISPQR